MDLPPVPLKLVKSPPWSMNWGMTRWKLLFTREKSASQQSFEADSPSQIIELTLIPCSRSRLHLSFRRLQGTLSACARAANCTTIQISTEYKHCMQSCLVQHLFRFISTHQCKALGSSLRFLVSRHRGAGIQFCQLACWLLGRDMGVI